MCEHTKLKTNTGNNTFLFVLQSKPKNSLPCNKYPDIRFRMDSSFDIRYYPVQAGFWKLLSGTTSLLNFINRLHNFAKHIWLCCAGEWEVGYEAGTCQYCECRTSHSLVLHFISRGFLVVCSGNLSMRYTDLHCNLSIRYTDLHCNLSMTYSTQTCIASVVFSAYFIVKDCCIF